jgi:pimeloyl-ACP methyl ester carboxylesterase
MKRSAILFSLCLFIFAEFSCNNSPSGTAGIPAAAGDKPAIDDQGVAIDYTDSWQDAGGGSAGDSSRGSEGDSRRGGSGKGDTTLLFIHGWCINKTYWSDQVAWFSRRYRVVTMDLPGFGLSGKNRSEWTSQAFGRDVDTVLSKLNCSHVILVGHSMAGDIILEAALHARDRVIGLVGIDNFKGIAQAPDSQSRAEQAAAINELKHHFSAMVTEYFSQSLFSRTTDSAIRKRVLGDVLRADTAVAIACQEQPDYNEMEALKALRMPLHLISSDVTPTDTAGFRNNGIPLRIKYIHGSGHFPMVEAPAKFNALLEQTIAEVGGEG